MIVHMDEFHFTTKSMEQAVRGKSEVGKQFGLDKKIWSLKTLAVRYKNEEQVVLCSSLGHESYDAEEIAMFANYETADVIHRGINTRELLGLQEGEVGVIVPEEKLENIKGVHFSQRARKELKRSNSIVVYPIGNQDIFIMRGKIFVTRYSTFLEGAGIKTNIMAD
jgi:hypothetical protein